MLLEVSLISIRRIEMRMHPIRVGFVLKSFLGSFFPRELKKAKVREYLTLKLDSLSVHEMVEFLPTISIFLGNC